MKNNSVKSAFFISISYMVLGIIWIYFSDSFVEHISYSTQQLNTLQTYKGLFYIIITTLSLYFLALKFLKSQFNEYLSHLETLAKKSALEDSLHTSALMYKNLFDNMIEAVAHCRMIYDNDVPIDYEYINVNQKFIDMTGFKDVIGKKISDFVPNYLEENPESIEGFDKVARDGEPTQWKHYFKTLDQWYHFSVYSPQKYEFICIIDNITAEKKGQIELDKQYNLLKTIVESSPDAIFVKDLEGNYLLFNSGASKIVNIAPDKIIGKSDKIIFSPETAEILRQKDLLLLEKGIIESQEEELTIFNGEKKTFWVTKGPLRNSDGNIFALFGMSHDITERKQIDLQLLQHNINFESIAEGVYAVDNHNHCTYINSAALSLLGLYEQDVIGKVPHEVFHYRHQDGNNFETEECSIAAAVLDGVTANLEDVFIRTNGTTFPVFVTVSPIFQREVLLGSVVTFIDISDQKISQERLKTQKDHFNYLAHHDPLTGLPNRLSLLETLESLTTALNAEPFALMFLDLDGFKEINDSYGHRFGDQILIQFSQLLQEHFPLDTVIVRTGGDEFVIILPCHGHQEVLIGAIRELILKLNKPFSINGMDIYITASIGVSVFPENSSTTDGLLQQADAAMYNAKSMGKNTFSFYDVNFTEKALQRTTIASNLKKALTEEVLELYYQPQVDANHGKIIGLEALLRWPTSEGMIPPSLFIPIAEESGLILEVGEFVLLQGCQSAARWSESGILHGRVAINVSARQLTHIDFISTLDRIIQDTHCHPEWIELEITESSILENPTKMITLLSLIKSKGFHISIDDFGTGYSSLSYLKNLPIDKLKIDQSFVRNVTHEPKNQTIVQTIIALAKGLRMSVIAEGVETNDELVFLRNNGVDSIQGYFYYKPMEKNAVETLLRENTLRG